MAYLAPVHRPSSVRHALKLSFTSPDSHDLVVAKANRLEIWSPRQQQEACAPGQQHPRGPALVLRHSAQIYGKVTLLHKLRPATSHTDHLFVATDRYHYFTLGWDGDRQRLTTEKRVVDIAEKAARDSQTGDRVHIDPTHRFMALEVYEGIVNVLPIAHAGKGKRKAANTEIGELGDPILVRIPELVVRSSCFLHRRDGGARAKTEPLFAVLYEDSQNHVRIKVRELEYSPSLRPGEEPATAGLDKGFDVTGALEMGSSFMIPLPAPTYGLLVVGETGVAYVDEWDHAVVETTPLEAATVFVAWCQLDEHRYVLADDYKKLYLLMVQTSPTGDYRTVQIDLLGETSRASTLVYLDQGRVFVGSHQGDSQVVQISPQRLHVVQTFPNIAPILDFTVMDMGNRSLDAPVNEFSSGQARIVTGTGAFDDGSLRSVRSGVGLEGRVSLGDLGAPISSIFSLRSTATAPLVDTLIVSHVSHTSAIVFTEGGVEARDEYRGFDLAHPTLFAGSLPDGRAVQVTSSCVLLADTEGGMVTDRWQAPHGTSMTAVAADGHKILVSLRGEALVLLDLASASVRVQAQRQFGSDEQISCIALAPSIPNACVAGFWKDSRVALLSQHDLQPILTERVAEDDAPAVPRSLVVANIFKDRPATLFVGLADGNVVTYSVHSAPQRFSARKSIVLGTQQANFALLPRADGLQNVFATCEHPSLIYGSDGRLVYSAVTAENATCVASFDSFGDYAGAIAIATADEAGANELTIAVVDEERTTHVQDLFLFETVRRIAYSPELRAFGLGCIKRTLSAGTEQVESHVKLVDEVAFKELDTWALNPDELVECVIRCGLDDGSGGRAEHFVVGTAYLDDRDPHAATKGRILVLEISEDRRIKLVIEMSVRGACRCLATCQGRIVAALIKTVVIYDFEYQTGSTPALIKKASYRTATAPIDISVTDHTIAVTDLMKSLSLLEYRTGARGVADSLVEVARHPDTVWGTAVARVDEHTYLQSDAEGNLMVLQHDVHGFSEADRRRLRATSEMRLGEMVNRIRPIAVTPSPAAVVVPQALLATVDGALYVYAAIRPHRQDLLMRLQALMADVVASPGRVRFATFRGYKSQVRDRGDEGPVRFVDGELVEKFLDLDAPLQEEVVKQVGLEVGEMDMVREMVEGLRRIH